MADKRARVLFKRTDIEGVVPLASDLVPAEFAVNLADKAIYTKQYTTGQIIQVNDAGYIKTLTEALKFDTLEDALLALMDDSNEIRRPSAIRPYNGETDVDDSPVLIGDEYQNSLGRARVHRRFQVTYGHNDYTSPVLDVTVDSDTLQITSELPSGRLKWRCRDEDERGGISVWSCSSLFTTTLAFIENPELTVEGAPIGVDEDPILSASAFIVRNGTDVHKSTDWRILLNGVPVWEASQKEGAERYRIQVPTGILSEDTDYSFQVRYNGNSYGSSEWVEVLAKTKLNFVSAPVIVYPIPGFENYAGTVSASTFEDPESVEWEASLSDSFEDGQGLGSYSGVENLLVWQPNVAFLDHQGVRIYIRLRHKVGNYKSAWSNVIYFISPVIEVNPPSLSVDASLSALPEDPTLSTGQFSVTNGDDDHAYTEFEILQGGNVIWSEKVL